MDVDALNAMKYGELFKMAKERLNITKRLPKENLVEKLLEFHQKMEAEHVSDDESGKDVEEVKVAKKCKKNRKRKAKKEEAKFNETFSMDEQEQEEKVSPIPDVQLEEKPKKSQRKRKTSKKQEIEGQLIDGSVLPEEGEVKQPPKKKTKGKKPSQKDQEVQEDPKIEHQQIIEQQLTDVSMPSEEEVKQQPKKKTKGRKPSKKDEAVQKEDPKIENEQIIEQQLTDISMPLEEEVKQVALKKKLKGRSRKTSKKDEEPKKEEPVINVHKGHEAIELPSNNQRISVAKTPLVQQSPQTEKEQPVAQKRTRNSRGSLTSNPEPAKKLKKSSSFTVSPAVTPTQTPIVSKTEEKKPTPVQKPSKLPRKSINFATPAKIASTPAKKVSNIPKAKGVPNFAELHQKQFNKMQSVDEYVERKKAGASKTPAKVPVSNKTSTPALNTSNATTKTPAMKFNFVSGLQKPVFTAKGGVVGEVKQRVMATVKENVMMNSSMSSIMKKGSSLLNMSARGSELNNSSRVSSVNGKEILKGVRTNRRFELQMAHRSMKH